MLGKISDLDNAKKHFKKFIELEPDHEMTEKTKILIDEIEKGRFK
ncbi:hypothetical protein GF327_09500 [Candidatus Woesearchaeota archaeon]|nr:hypothetical protein [Candidatus Woesearchaeota archaeon]